MSQEYAAHTPSHPDPALAGEGSFASRGCPAERCFAALSMTEATGLMCAISLSSHYLRRRTTEGHGERSSWYRNSDFSSNAPPSRAFWSRATYWKGLPLCGSVHIASASKPSRLIAMAARTGPSDPALLLFLAKPDMAGRRRDDSGLSPPSIRRSNSGALVANSFHGNARARPCRRIARPVRPAAFTQSACCSCPSLASTSPGFVASEALNQFLFPRRRWT